MRIRARVFLLISTLGCASARAHPEPDVDATLARGGGLSAITETIHVSRIATQTNAELRRGGSRPRKVRLSSGTLAAVLGELDSLSGAVPPAVRDSDALQRICGDAVTTHLTVRNGQHVRVAHETCPHFGAELDTFWSRVNRIYELLAAAAP